VGKEVFYTSAINIGYLMRSAFQAPSLFVFGSPLKFRHKLIHDVLVLSIPQLRLIGHGYMHTLELYDG